MNNGPKETRLRWMRDALKTRRRHRDDWLAKAEALDFEAQQMAAALVGAGAPRDCPCCGNEVVLNDDGELVDAGTHEAERQSVKAEAERCRQLASAEQVWIDFGDREVAAFEASS